MQWSHSYLLKEERTSSYLVTSLAYPPTRRPRAHQGWTASHLGHDGGGEGAAVIHPAVHTQLRGRLAGAGQGSIRVEELPLGVEEAAAFLWPLVRVQRDGDPQQGVLPEGPRAIGRARAVVQDGDPAAVRGRGGREVLQDDVREHQEAGQAEEAHLKELEAAQAAHRVQQLMEGHRGATGEPRGETQQL